MQLKGAYQKAYDESIKDPSSFWDRAAQEIHWYKKYSKVLEISSLLLLVRRRRNQHHYNAVDLHVKNGRADSRDHLRQPGDQHGEKVHLPRALDQSRSARGDSRAGRMKGDRGPHADDP